MLYVRNFLTCVPNPTPRFIKSTNFGISFSAVGKSTCFTHFLTTCIAVEDFEAEARAVSS